MLELRTLGGLSLTASGLSESPAGAPQRSRLLLLAAVACAGERGIGRDRLHALFWPESDTEHARGSLNQALYTLRRDLDEPELFQGTTDLRVNAAVVRCDAVELERAVSCGRLHDAAVLYGGPFLDGVFARSPDLEQWIEGERHGWRSFMRACWSGWRPMPRSAATSTRRSRSGADFTRPIR